MDVWYNPSRTIAEILCEVALRTPGFDSGFDPDVRPADPRFGDFQANGILPLAKRQGVNPRQLANALVAKLTEDAVLPAEWVAFEIAGPGFINFKLSPSFLSAWLRTYSTPENLHHGAVEAAPDAPTVVIDYSSPNTAKQMHVGHIRSSVIGETLARLFQFQGAKVIRDNHIGDWGTQFGILIHAIKTSGYDPDSATSEDPLEDFERLYKEGSLLTKEDPEALDAARAELVKLQQGDPENVRLWKAINEASNRAFNEIYARLDIHFDLTLGESFYRDRVDQVYDELTRHGIAVESEGALVVFHPGHERFATQPFIIRKSDGASNYASTDLATVLYRVETLQADEIVYVTDGRQQDHFQQLFLTVERWFAATGRPLPKLRHVWFGTVLGEDGKAIKTRSGEPIRLKQLLDEAERRAHAIVTEKSPDLPETERIAIATAAGIGAVRYADLSQNRTSDYTFAWDKLLSFEGNTAPYLLYAYARLHSVFRKVGEDPEADFSSAPDLETEAELTLARKLIGLSASLDQALADLRPHFLCTYLFELAGAFSTFYNAEKIAVEDPAVRTRRLLLSQAVLRTIRLSVRLLGIRPIQRM